MAFNDEKTIPRKPVRGETGPNGTPRTATIRMIPDEDSPSEYEDEANVKPSQDADSLAPALSRLDLGGPFESGMADVGMTPRPTTGGHKIPRRSLDKPLPKPPGNNTNIQQYDEHIGNREPQDRSPFAEANSSMSTKDLERKLGVTGILDLGHTENTTIHERIAPAVVHETVRHNVHEIREERITRDFHEHYYYHRILPIKDVEVRPARHYVQDSNGKLREVSEDQVPGGALKNTQQVMNEVFRDMLPKSNMKPGPRKFTAKDFPGTEGDYKEYKQADGSILSEQYWVHPPELDTVAKELGQTRPFYLGSPNPADDGLRT